MLTVFHIGKESNLLEQQEEGVLLTDPQAVYAGVGEWEVLRLHLNGISIAELAARSGVSQRMLRNLRQGNRRPSAKTLEAIAAALVQMLDEGEATASDSGNEDPDAGDSGDGAGPRSDAVIAR